MPLIFGILPIFLQPHLYYLLDFAVLGVFSSLMLMISAPKNRTVTFIASLAFQTAFFAILMTRFTTYH